MEGRGNEGIPHQKKMLLHFMAAAAGNAPGFFFVYNKFTYLVELLVGDVAMTDISV